jgi:hypothetical protein
VIALVTKDTNIFAGVPPSVFRSSLNDPTWTDISSGLPVGAGVTALIVNGNYLVAGTRFNGVWRRPLSEIVASSREIPTGLPAVFNLSQNYPNPFNPSTRITYDLPERSLVTLEVYNVLGQIIATIVNAGKDAGIYSVEWNTSASGGDGSGLYFYRLTAVSAIDPAKVYMRVRKMMLIR